MENIPRLVSREITYAERKAQVTVFEDGLDFNALEPEGAKSTFRLKLEAAFPWSKPDGAKCVELFHDPLIILKWLFSSFTILCVIASAV